MKLFSGHPGGIGNAVRNAIGFSAERLLQAVSPSYRPDIGRMIYGDRVARAPYAFGVWLATLEAQRMGISKLQIFEFGVAQGDGLVNLCGICELFASSTGMQFEIYGFDSDSGMPRLEGYRDHPELWHQGQFKSDHDAIRRKLTPNASLISGNIKDTVGDFCRNKLSEQSPVGFVSIDVDLYSSTVPIFDLFKHRPACYLPTTILYFDDINDLLTCNKWCGEMLAIREFNEANDLRKMEEMRVRQNHPPAGWHDHIYGLHVLDHPVRTGEITGGCLDINITAI
jgi:hypothetical protein